MIEGLHIVALALYCLGAAIMGISFARGGRGLPPLAAGAVGAALLAHAAALAVFTSTWGELPLVGLGPSLSTLAFLIAFGSLVAAIPGHAGTVGLLVIPLVVVLGAVASAVGVAPQGEATQFRGIWFALHVILAFLGYAGLTVAAAAGVMYLLQFRELKSKHFGAIFRFFPPLESLDRLGRRGIVFGFPFLTLSVLVGWAWTARFDVAELPGNPKLVWVVVSWVVFLAALIARLGGGRPSRRGAVASVIGFVVVVVAYLVLRVQAARGGAFL
ncbi:MAG TPA: cytochrome c biogenesis protein CcsA [Longimicrobiaceae bacterium]